MLGDYARLTFITVASAAFFLAPGCEEHVIGDHPTDQPSNPNPTNGATTVGVDDDLSWVCSDPDQDPLTYDIYFGTTSPPPLVKGDHDATKYDPGTMPYVTKYYWKIVAKDDRGNGIPGPEWSFTTQGHGVFLGKWGSYGSGNGQLDSPWGVAAGFNKVYVADSANYRIQYFTPTGSFLGKWGSYGSGDGQFEWPDNAAVAPNSNIYVVDGSRVQYFTATGSFLGKWGFSGSGNGQFDGAWGVAVAPNGSVYVTDSGNYRVQYFTANGSFLGKWGSYGSGDGQFGDSLEDIAIGPSSTVFVADGGNDRIQYFSSTGGFLGKWGSWGYDNGQFDCPVGVATAGNGAVSVTDYSARVQYFTATGSFLGKWGSYGSGDGQFDDPKGIVVEPSSGYIYVADHGNNRIQYFR